MHFLILRKNMGTHKQKHAVKRADSDGKIVLAQATQRYSGPIPSPEQLSKYEQTLPGAAHRILTVFENQTAHRIECEKTIINRQWKLAYFGQILGFVLCLFFGVLATILALNGCPKISATIFGVLIISIAIIFVLRKTPNK